MIAVNPIQPISSKTNNRKWPAIVLTLLLGHMVLMMTAVFVINRNNHDAVIPDHDQRSAHWDADHGGPGGGGQLP
jgi:hypothetical protein